MTNSLQGFDYLGQAHRFGDWSFTLREDEIADICYDGVTVLRSLRCVIRDSDWNTALVTVTGINQEQQKLSLQVEIKGFGAELEGQLTFQADNNQASYEIELESKVAFSSNRVGIIVLHSPADSGHLATVTDPSGKTLETSFPVEISPNQPMRNIKLVTWARSGLEIDLAFEGEVFEMEDQRNWTDASFKTYSRPLDLPFPFQVAKGEIIKQQARLIVSGKAHKAPDNQVAISLDQTITAPEIQLALSNAKDPESNFEAVGQAVLVELDLASTNWQAVARRAARSALPIDLRLIVSNKTSAQDLVAAIESLGTGRLRRIAAFDSLSHVSNASTSDLLSKALASCGLELDVVAGARSHFTELNRNREFPRENLAGVCFSSTPLFHATETAQLLEAVAMQRLTAVNAVAIADGLPVHVGPITLRPRFNNVATGAQPGPSLADLSEGFGAEFTSTTDPRQGSNELAAWVIASFCAFAIEGVASITWFEQWGPRGAADIAGNPYPAFHAIRLLSELAGKEISIARDISEKNWALGYQGPNGPVVVASNISSSPIEFEVSFNGLTNTLKLEPFAFGEFELN